MAFSANKNSWEIKQYTVDAKDVIGHGAYGIVYIGTNAENTKIAVKSIDGKRNPRIMTQNLKKLLQLRHPNTVHIFDIHQHEQTCWMFMELCEHGDLNSFFEKREVILNDRLDIMKQIASGLVHLHAYNIIHRDIKPGNVLVASDSPILVKLADFDLSRFLDFDSEVSVMSSNVGTQEFKAPEFFLGNKREKITYHRNVDIFAMGLTYLAIIQAKKGNTVLSPCIETAQDPSELVTPAGLTLVTRMRYKVQDLNIVVIDDATPIGSTSDAAGAGSLPEDPRMTSEIKKLIRKMTCFKPEDRLSVNEVYENLQTIAESKPKNRPPPTSKIRVNLVENPSGAAITQQLKSEDNLTRQVSKGFFASEYVPGFFYPLI